MRIWPSDEFSLSWEEEVRGWVVCVRNVGDRWWYVRCCGCGCAVMRIFCGLVSFRAGSFSFIEAGIYLYKLRGIFVRGW